MSDTTAALINYMSQKLLDVAELNSVLDQFGSRGQIPEKGMNVTFNRMPRMQFKAVVANSDWIRVVRNAKTDWNRSPGCAGYDMDFGGFDFGDTPAPLEIRELTAQDRAELEALGLF